VISLNRSEAEGHRLKSMLPRSLPATLDASARRPIFYQATPKGIPDGNEP
jgi:hypothetical protein